MKKHISYSKPLVQYLIRLFSYLFVCLFAYLLIPLKHARAVGEFSADYNVEYAVSPAGITIVTQRVTLTNQRSNLYPKQYAIVIDTDNIQNVIARDGSGVITPDINQHDGKTDITLTFNKEVVGVGKQLAFTLRYENLDFARKNGSIWEINIPGINDDPDLASYSVSLQVPPSFGPNAYISPLPSSAGRWNKEQMVQGGISAAYGDKQQFSVDLSYFLENPKFTPVYTEISLPPDTGYQKVYITSLVPKPTNVRRDEDGNWLARYDLRAGQDITVVAKIVVTISLFPEPELHSDTSTISSYTKPLPYWESSNEKFQELAKTYKTPHQIYTYVVNTLSYDYARAQEKATRKGALAVMTTPGEAVCMEFTDLFIAMARAAGIPSRELVGYAYTTNAKLRPLSLENDVLHAWPEYYDSGRNMWIAVDPTWGNTTGGVNYFDKLDFNHIVFAIHGTSSTHPLPAGSYKKIGDINKSVQVNFIEKNVSNGPRTLIPSFNFPRKIIPGLGGKGFVKLINDSNQSVAKAEVLIQTSPRRWVQQATAYDIPPFGAMVYPIVYPVGEYLARGNGKIDVSVNGTTTTYSFEITPLYWILIPASVIVITLLIVIGYIIKRKS